MELGRRARARVRPASPAETAPQPRVLLRGERSGRTVDPFWRWERNGLRAGWG